MARQSKYSDKIATEICQRIAEGECLPAVCRDPKMPSKRAVMTWLTLPEHQTFRAMYAAAREMQADALFDLMRDIADDGRNDYMERQRKDGSKEVVFDHENIQRSKLRVDTLKWQASKLAPKKYGDLVRTESTVEVTDKRTDTQIIARLTALADELGLGLDRDKLVALVEASDDGVRH